MQMFIGLTLMFVMSLNCIESIPLKDPLPPASNVTANVTWTFASGSSVTNVILTVANLKASQYTAIGLGQNQSMGEAHVFMCKRYANDEVVIQRFINPENHHPPQPAGSEQGGVFTPLPSKFEDGIVTCQFTLSNFSSSLSFSLNTLRPLSQTGQYFPLFAVGVVNATGDSQYHDGRQAQPNLVQLNQNQNLFYQQKDSF